MIESIKNILFKRRNENQKEFFVGLSLSAALFLLGIIYLIFPSVMNGKLLVINNFFVIFIALFSVINLVKFILFNYKTNEKIYLCLLGCGVGILNIILDGFLDDDTVFTMSIMLFTLAVSGVKLFSIDYYHSKKDSYWYIETMLLVILVVIGIVVSLTVLNNSAYQVLSLGFFIIIVSILDAIDLSIRCMLRASRFVKNIKLR